jgi:beta-lactam-binding protein with PASTA domain
MINSVENYIGRNIDEVRMELQTLFASSPQPLLSLKEPFMYQYSAETPGVILRQNPEPGKDISGPTALEFVVSLGPENVMITVPRFAGLSVNEALAEISRTGVDFVFTARPAREGEKAETVVSQTPLTDVPVTADTKVALTVTLPAELKNDEAAGLFTYTMPKNPYPLPVRLEALLPSGERRRLLTVEYAGGDFTVPYRLPVDTVLVLSMVNREIHRETVKPLTDQLYLDQL